METHAVTVRATQVWRGPNIAAYMPVIRVTLDIGPYEEHPSTDFPGFVERLTAWLPGIAARRYVDGSPSAFPPGAINSDRRTPALPKQPVGMPIFEAPVTCP
jgi:hypothetical protein